MAGIFTRNALNRIMEDESLTPQQRTEQVYSLYGRALDDGFISKSAAQQAQEAAIENAKAEWEKGQTAPDPRQSDEYKALAGEFDAYRAMQQARTGKDYGGVKPKFFETVYGMVDRGDGAKPVEEQLKGIREKYEEYFAAAQPTNPKPSFGAPTEGSMPKGDEGAVTGFEKAWGFNPGKK
jgi:hypothetical protein